MIIDRQQPQSTLIHAAIIADLRLRLHASPFDMQCHLWNDEQMLRRTFSNYRDQRGLRLTQFGNHLMQHCFQSYEFLRSAEDPLPDAHVLFLDCVAKMPYFVNRRKLVVYDERFAVFLRVVGGDIAILIETNFIG